MKLRPAGALTPPAAWPVRGKLTGADDYICHPRPLPYLVRGFFVSGVSGRGKGVVCSELATGVLAGRVAVFDLEKEEYLVSPGPQDRQYSTGCGGRAGRGRRGIGG